MKIAHTIHLEALTGSRRALDWGEHDRIALITCAGVRIFQPVFQPYLGTEKKMKFEESLIPLPEKRSSDTGVEYDDVEDLLFKDGEEVPFAVNVMFDRTGNAGVEAGELSVQAYVEACWSPIIDDETRECFLATLTYDHQCFVLLRNQDNEYVRVSLNLSDLAHHEFFASSSSSSPVDLSSVEDSLSEMFDWNADVGTDARKRLVQSYATGVSVMRWVAGVFFGESSSGLVFAVLITATRSGHVCFWKISLSGASLAAFFCSDVPVDSICSTRVGQGGGGHDVLVFLGTRHGTVEAVWLVGAETGRFSAVRAICVDFDHPYLEFTQDFSVSNVACSAVSDSDDRLVLCLSKNHMLVVLLIKFDRRKRVVRLLHARKMDTGVLPISHLSFLTSDVVLAASETCNVSKVTIKVEERRQGGAEDETRIALRSELLDFEDETFVERFSATGVAVSGSGAFVCVSHRVSAPYDHLHQRQTSRLTLFRLDDDEAVVRKLSTGEDSLARCADLLECARLADLKPEALRDHAEFDVDENLRHAKIFRWLTIAGHKGRSGAGAVRRRQDGAVYRLSALKILEESANVDWSADPEARNDVMEKLPRIVHWLRYLWGDHPRLTAALESIRLALETKEIVAPANESCPICGSHISDFVAEEPDPCVARCTDNHPFPRSSVTMEVCSQLPLRRCNRCLAYAGDASPWLKTKVCLLCDGILSPTT